MRLNRSPVCLYPLPCLLSLLSLTVTTPSAIAQVLTQTPRPADPRVVPGRDNLPPSLQPLPEVLPAPPVQPTAPPPLMERPVPTPTPGDRPPDLPSDITVKEFRVISPEFYQQLLQDGSKPCPDWQATDRTTQTFSQPEINRVTEPFLGKPLSFAELLQAADAIARLYVDNRYLISGAYIPALPPRCPLPQTNAIVPVVVVGDRVEPQAIRVNFVKPEVKTDEQGITRTEYRPASHHRLRENYIRRRLALATRAPLNSQRLLEALQLLKLNPLIQDVRATLSPGTTPGQSFLEVNVVEARSLRASALLDNGRSPSIGSFRRQFEGFEGNLTGLGDSLRVSYANTSGSHAGDFTYTIPINPRNGTLSLDFGSAASRIVEEPFDILDIRSRSRYLEFAYRQPVIQTPTRELALGISLGRQYTRATLIDGEIPFPVPGSDFAGITRSTTLRLFQEWRSNRDTSTLALRSQLSFGLPLFNSTDNEGPPDARFVAWRGQAQWIKLLAPDTLLLLRGDLQLADRALVPVEQFGLGGLSTVRGYRQDAILGDSGLLATAELRVPILRLPQIGGLLQIAPFVDVGTAWNRSGFANPDPRTLAGTGVGLRLQIRDYLTARFDWGIPLVSIDGSRDTLQERGLYFSLILTPF